MASMNLSDSEEEEEEEKDALPTVTESKVCAPIIIISAATIDECEVEADEFEFEQ
jgi:hypothetical protein